MFMAENELVNYLLEKGTIKDQCLLEALLKIKRRDFLPPEYRCFAESDVVVPTLTRNGHLISTSSQPSLIVEMLQELSLCGNENILDIGTGTGFSTALLGTILKHGRISSIEYDYELCEIARSNLSRYEIDNVNVINTDGFYGYPKEAPYDAIISMVACGEIPIEWFLQLEIGGIILMPLLAFEGYTPVVKFTKYNSEDISGVVIIPASFISMENHRTPVFKKTFFRGSKISARIRKNEWNGYSIEYEMDCGLS